MINPLYLPELREMLGEGNAEELREFVTALHPARTAEFMEGLNADEVWRVLQYAEPSVRGAPATRPDQNIVLSPLRQDLVDLPDFTRDLHGL